jgi:2-oxoisovalerate dehydrogenase E2 component (dihydrolipoyl transacylase)
MTDKTFLLPDAGEGLTEAEIVNWHVKVGDHIIVNQTIVEIETAKAVVELPSPFAGVVAEIHVSEGDVVAVGAPIMRVTTTAEAPAVDTLAPTAAPERQAVLVGYGVRENVPTIRRPRRPAYPHGTDTPEQGPPGEAAKPVRHGGLEVGRHTEELLSHKSPVLAKPPVRKLAKDLGVELATVAATGLGGVVTRADVERVAQQGSLAASPLPVLPTTRSAAEREERIPVRGLTRAMADAMVRSAFSAPHVTEWVQVDVTKGLALMRRLAEAPEFAEAKPTPLLIAAAGLLRAIRRNPGINASWDDAAQEIVRKNYVNLGIAAATPRGLLVPNIKEAQQLSMPELSQQLRELVRVARAGTTSPAALSGGTITITNIGVFGVDGGTPILNPGESAILCLGQISPKPWVHKGKVRVRQVMELTLAFDHRLIDGALGSTVLAEVAAFLHNPALALSLP